MDKTFTVNGYNCAGNIVYCNKWDTIEQAKKDVKYIHKTNKERAKKLHYKIIKTEIIPDKI